MALLGRGNVFVAQQKWELALNDMKHAHKGLPDQMDIFLIYGDVLLKSGRTEEFLDVWNDKKDQYLPLFSTPDKLNAEQALMLGHSAAQQLMMADAFPEAKHVLEIIWQRSPNHRITSKLLRVIYDYEGDQDKLKQLFESMLQAHPDDAESLTMLAGAESLSGNHGRSIELATKALTLIEDKEMPMEKLTLLNSLGQFHQHVGNPSKAVEFHQKAIELVPEDNPRLKGTILFFQATALFQQDRQASIEPLKQAVELLPDVQLVLQTAAVYLGEVGDISTAIELLNKANTIRETSRNYSILERIYRATGQTEEADKAAAKRDELQPQMADTDQLMAVEFKTLQVQTMPQIFMDELGVQNQ
eukprot:TRINITY_DN523_c0_g1_i1.p1 TRINITY_DN523_c0_g1~~TRINITY_DN523_c0_g1_i1.p1  ORF type:complete len:359 (-),score=129.71 TRINITY_DN523_c0_g1_i1:21-1097(-)